MSRRRCETSFPASCSDEEFDPGIKFADSAGEITLNYLKLHIDKREAKNTEYQTDGRYKPSVRMFKNARNTATERGLFVDRAASSYFVECLLTTFQMGVSLPASNSSKSHSLSASMVVTEDECILIYDCLNEPNVDAPETMHMQRGTARLALTGAISSKVTTTPVETGPTLE